jgi:methylation protein EvaC
LIFSANTITHISNYNSVFSNISQILTDYGTLIIEEPSLLETVKKNSYDQFYNEHIYVFSTIALQNILKKNDLEIYDIENINVHGGSNRYYIKKIKNKKFKLSTRFKKNMILEKKYGLDKFSCYKKFSKKVQDSKKGLIKLLKNLKKNNKKIIGYGASAKAVTILNYCNLKENYFDFFYDTTKQKIGKYLPGTRIRVLKYQKLKNNKMYVFLGAWNFYKEILKKEKFFYDNSGKFITHIPYPKIIQK